VEIRKQIKYKGLKIILYEYKIEAPISEKSNIEAFDLNNKLVWTAENCANGRYFSMQLDEDNNTIEASDGSAMFYDIELSNGTIVNEFFRK
jgi:hypothetical protein